MVTSKAQGERDASLVAQSQGARTNGLHIERSSPNLQLNLSQQKTSLPTNETDPRVASTARVGPEPRQMQRAVTMFTRQTSNGSFAASTTRPSLRRQRSSFLQDFKAALKEVMPGDEDTNDNTSTIDEEAGAVDIPSEFNALIKRLCDEKLTDTAAVEGPITTWRLKTLPIDDSRMLAFFNDALPSVIARLTELEQRHRIAQKKVVFWTVSLTFFDTVSDYVACIVLSSTDSSYAIPMLVVLCVSMVCQAVVARFVTNEGPVAVVGALLGLKPVMDGINIIFDIPTRPGASESLGAFGYTRTTETATESIPFAVMQVRANAAHWNDAHCERRINLHPPICRYAGTRSNGASIYRAGNVPSPWSSSCKATNHVSRVCARSGSRL